MANGLTLRSMGRLVGRHLIHKCVLEKWAGKQNDKDTWTDLGSGSTFNCRHVATGGVLFGGTSAAQDFDSTLLVALTAAVSGEFAFERTSRYRMRVFEYKTPKEKTAPGGPPELKRQYWLEMVRSEMVEDNEGSDFLAVLQCRNSKPWAALA